MRTLTVTVLKDDEPFIKGDFDVRDEDYDVVLKLLSEVEMTSGQASSLLAGYMHARDIDQVSEDMGKLAMLAAVFILNEGKTDIAIPLEQSAGQGGKH